MFKGRAFMVGVVTVLLFSSAAKAELIQRSGAITDVQIESHERSASRADVVWIKLPGAWSANCNSDWAWFNAKSSSQLLAGALSARVSSATVTVYVDDSLPKLEGYCQVAIMTL
jgi:hypothetical protein